MNKNGEYGAGSLWGKHQDGQPMQYAVHDGDESAAGAHHADVR